MKNKFASNKKEKEKNKRNAFISLQDLPDLHIFPLEPFQHTAGFCQINRKLDCDTTKLKGRNCHLLLSIKQNLFHYISAWRLFHSIKGWGFPY